VSENQCNHINLVKQVGPIDGGVENSTRYRCKECGAFFVVEPYEVTVTFGPVEGQPTRCPQCGHAAHEANECSDGVTGYGIAGDSNREMDADCECDCGAAQP